MTTITRDAPSEIRANIQAAEAEIDQLLDQLAVAQLDGDTDQIAAVEQRIMNVRVHAGALTRHLVEVERWHAEESDKTGSERPHWQKSAPAAGIYATCGDSTAWYRLT